MKTRDYLTEQEKEDYDMFSDYFDRNPPAEYPQYEIQQNRGKFRWDVAAVCGGVVTIAVLGIIAGIKIWNTHFNR